MKSRKKWKGKSAVRENLRSRAPGLVQEYFNAGDLALAPGKSWEEMHSFRLLTKRFRYTLEIFRPAYGPGLDARIDKLRDLQTLLGDINDSIVSSGMLLPLPGTENVRARLAKRAEAKTEVLRALWESEFAARRDRWQRYLVQYACRPTTRRVRVTAESKEAVNRPKSAE